MVRAAGVLLPRHLVLSCCALLSDTGTFACLHRSQAERGKKAIVFHMSEPVKRHTGPVGLTTTSECTCAFEGMNEIKCAQGRELLGSQSGRADSEPRIIRTG